MRPHHAFGLRFIDAVLRATCDAVTSEGIEHIPRAESGRTLYISNHDDIVREVTVLNATLHRSGAPLAHLAAGENLFRYAVLRPLLSLQPLFPVPRGKGKGREIASLIERELAHGHPVWVAQGNGRNRGGNNVTHPNLIANLAHAHGTSIAAYLEETAVVPVAVSAAYDPALPGAARVLDLGHSRRADGLRAILEGIFLKKSDVHIAFGPRIAPVHHTSAAAASALDLAINARYHCFPSHELAYHERNRFPLDEWATRPVDLDMLSTHPLLARQIARLAPAVQPAALTRYARPVYNRLQARAASRSEMVPVLAPER